MSDAGRGSGRGRGRGIFVPAAAAVVVVVLAGLLLIPGAPGGFNRLVFGRAPEPDPVTAESVEAQRMVGQYVVANSRCTPITHKWPATGAPLGELAMVQGRLTATDECSATSAVTFVRTEITGAFVFSAWGRETVWDAAAHTWTTDQTAGMPTVWRRP